MYTVIITDVKRGIQSLRDSYCIIAGVTGTRLPKLCLQGSSVSHKHMEFFSFFVFLHFLLSPQKNLNTLGSLSNTIFSPIHVILDWLVKAVISYWLDIPDLIKRLRDIYQEVQLKIITTAESNICMSQQDQHFELLSKQEAAMICCSGWSPVRNLKFTFIQNNTSYSLHKVATQNK